MYTLPYTSVHNAVFLGLNSLFVMIVFADMGTALLEFIMYSEMQLQLNTLGAVHTLMNFVLYCGW